MALDWMLETIAEEQIELLIVAGDIFDLANPPNYAREQYYDFLGRLRATGCNQVVIVGGNHDSPTMLDAPSGLFKHFDIHVVGAATDKREDQLVEIKDQDGRQIGWVAAVPFLRDRDLRYSIAGQTPGQREKKLQAGITEHYREIADLVKHKSKEDQLRITTGHLYARGAESSARQDNIYIGSRENIQAEQFPELFHYVALGHIHRPQRVGSQERIRYSGSIIPLDFSETADQKSVVILDWQDEKLDAEIVEVPVFRRLKSIIGNLEEVEEKLSKFLAKRAIAEGPDALAPWLEIRISTDKPIPGLAERLQDLIDSRPAEILAIRLERTGSQGMGNQQEVLPELDELDPEAVFKKLISGGSGELPADGPELLDSFRELRDWHQQQKMEMQ